MSRLFNPFISMSIMTKQFSDPFEMEFNSDWGVGKLSSATAKIYNVNDETLQLCEPNKETKAQIIVNAGYDKDFGVVFLGDIVSFENKQTGNDYCLEMKLSDKSAKLLSARVAKNYPAGMSSSLIITDILSSYGLFFFTIDPTTQKVFTKGLSLNDSLGNALKKIAKDINSDFYLKNGQAVFQSKDPLNMVPCMILSYDSGLLQISKTGKGYNVKCLFQYKIGAGDWVMIISEKYTGLLRAVNGKHTFTAGNRTTEFEGVV